jgi:hypothetical protein
MEDMDARHKAGMTNLGSVPRTLRSASAVRC